MTRSNVQGYLHVAVSKTAAETVLAAREEFPALLVSVAGSQKENIDV